jgi:polygalacturonase
MYGIIYSEEGMLPLVIKMKTVIVKGFTNVKIQEAIDECGKGGGMVFLPPGEYMLTAETSLKSCKYIFCLPS